MSFEVKVDIVPNFVNLKQSNFNDIIFLYSGAQSSNSTKFILGPLRPSLILPIFKIVKYSLVIDIQNKYLYKLSSIYF